jgi:hypothetical protein
MRHSKVVRRRLEAVIVVVVLLGSACLTGSPPRKPADLYLSLGQSDCVDLINRAKLEAGWCSPPLNPSFIVELAYVNPSGRYGLLGVSDADLLPSKDYAIWDREGQLALVASSDGSTSVQDLTYRVLRGLRSWSCTGTDGRLQCTPESP